MRHLIALTQQKVTSRETFKLFLLANVLKNNASIEEIELLLVNWKKLLGEN